MTELKKPKISTGAQAELDKAEENFKEFDEQVKSLTLDRMNQAPKLEVENQTKIAQADIRESDDIYLKPIRTIGSREPFNEKYRKEYEFQKEYVYFIAENYEIKGEDIDMWTKPFAGMPAEEWMVPVNKPIYGPRYLAEQIKRCTYHRLHMVQNHINQTTGAGQFYGAMAAQKTVNRLDAMPASKKRSIFMGSNTF